jgi:hypothetical protein
MPKVNFADEIKAAEREGSIGGGDYFKPREGANRVRLVSELLRHPGSYKGTPNFKWLTRVIDREDGKVKVWFMPHTIFKAIRDLQQTEDYAFEDIPMPYDLTVNAKNAGTKEVEYSVVPARKNTPLTAVELNLVDALKPLAEIQTAIRAKEDRQQDETRAPLHVVDAASHFDPDEIPF